MHNTSEKRREEVELTSKFIIPTPLLAILNNSLHSHACKFEGAECFGAVIVEIGAYITRRLLFLYDYTPHQSTPNPSPNELISAVVHSTPLQTNPLQIFTPNFHFTPLHSTPTPLPLQSTTPNIHSTRSTPLNSTPNLHSKSPLHFKSPLTQSAIS
jgi:hypothetical protein